MQTRTSKRMTINLFSLAFLIQNILKCKILSSDLFVCTILKDTRTSTQLHTHTHVGT